MTMTSKERMMRALNLEKPDRLPATLHQWQDYHLREYMGGVSALKAFQAVGLDASIAYGLGQWMGLHGTASNRGVDAWSPEWVIESEVIRDDGWERRTRHTVTTPGGELSYVTGINPMTAWMIEFLIKKPEDIYLVRDYMPVGRLNRAAAAIAYEALGDAGILRTGVWGDQAGCWQHACCLMDTQQLILECYDHPDWVHELLGILLEKKLRYVAESLQGVHFDLVETGGGAGSDTVISPKLHAEFCLPYDRALHDALHAAGQIVVYHTCGGMMHILDLILQNGCDASETLSPSSVGGNIDEPELVRRAYGGKIAMIGGLDQFSVLTTGTVEGIRAEVRRLFEGFGADGGYILSASDHFFETPVDHLVALAEAARECTY